MGVCHLTSSRVSRPRNSNSILSLVVGDLNTGYLSRQMILSVLSKSQLMLVRSQSSASADKRGNLETRAGFPGVSHTPSIPHHFPNTIPDRLKSYYTSLLLLPDVRVTVVETGERCERVSGDARVRGDGAIRPESDVLGKQKA